MGESGQESRGPFASLRRLVQTLLDIGRNRLELLLVEVQEERSRLVAVLLLVGLVLILALMTLMVTTVTVIIVCIRAGRLDLVIGVALVLLVATLVAVWRLRVRLKSWAPFAATLAELKKDKSCLEEKK
jgi:uncharacterized membrane protein YqjE